MTPSNLCANQRSSASIAILSAITGLLLCLTPAALAQRPDDSKSERPKLALQIGHTQQINEVVLSPNGKFVASSGFDQQVRIWDTATGDLWWTFTGTEFLSGKMKIGGLPSFEFTSDSRTIKITFNFTQASEWESSEIVATYDLQTGQLIPDSPKSKGLCSTTEKLITASPDGSTALCAQTQQVMPKPTAPPRPRKNRNLPPPPPPMPEQPRKVTRLYLRNKTWPRPVLLESNFHPAWDFPSFSPDGRTLLIYTKESSEDGTVKIWDLTTGQLLRELKQHSFKAFLENGQTILLYRFPVNHCNCTAQQIASLTEAQKHGAVELWDARLQTLKQSLPNQSVSAVSPDGKTLVLWRHSQKDAPPALEFWDVPSRTVKGKRVSGEHTFTFSPDSQTVAAIREKDNAIVLCDGRTGEIRHELPINQPRFAKMHYWADSSVLAIAENKGVISLWDVRNGQMKTKLDAYPLHQSDDPNFAFFSFSADGRLVVARLSKTIAIWHLDTGRLIRTVSGGLHDPIAFFSSDGRAIVEATLHQSFDRPQKLLWELNPLRLKVPEDNEDDNEDDNKPEDAEEQSKGTLRISPDGRVRAALKGDPTTVRLYDAESGRELYALAGHTKPVGQVHFSPDGKTIATVSGFPDIGEYEKTILGNLASLAEKYEENKEKPSAPESFGDKTVKLWDAQTGKLKFTLAAKGEIHYARFSADGSRLTVASVWGGDGRINAKPNVVQVWDTQSGEQIKSLERRKLAVTALSPDGSLTMNSDDNDMQTVLDTMTGEVRWAFKRNQYDIRGPFFSPDGKLLVTNTGATNDLRDAQTGKVLLTLPYGLGVSFSPDSRSLISSGSEDVSFYDVATGKVKWSLRRNFSSWEDETEISQDGRLVVGHNAEGTFTIYEVTSGRPLLTLVALFPFDALKSKPEWIAYTPEGYYTGSENAARYIRWRVGDKLLPAEAYAKEFHRPDLVQKALQVN